MTPDAKLAEVVGSKGMPRTELTKKLWQYIKKHGLQDKKNRRDDQRRWRAAAGLRWQGAGLRCSR